MPAHDRVRLHDDQDRAPISPRLSEEHPKQSLSRAEQPILSETATNDRQHHQIIEAFLQ
jgi:hypothetical protein